MGIKTHLRGLMDSVLKTRGYAIIDRALLYEWQTHSHTRPCYKHSQLPKESERYLQPNNPRLADLHTRYAKFTTAVTAPLVWVDSHVRPEDITYFRGDNAYLWQLRGLNMDSINYALTLYYVKSIDKLGLLDKLLEDDLFGNFTFQINNKIISRDLLDSIVEIYFLDKHLNVSYKDLTVLDIGAGYGRLAHRMVGALPSIKSYTCTDAVAVSTFICEHYLRFRNLGSTAKVVPLDELENFLDTKTVDLAINIHSFSECTMSSIEWWLSLLQKHRVRYLMIVPNTFDNDGKLLRTKDGKEFMTLVEKSGYTLVAKDPKYRDPIVQQFAINPTYHYLFEQKNGSYPPSV